MTHLTSASFATIQYRFDPGRTDSQPLTIGWVYSALSESGRYTLLLARKSLEATELNGMDWISQKILEKPSEFFKAEIDAIVAEDAARVLDKLRDKFCWSIEVTTALPATAELLKHLEEFFDRRRDQPRPSRLPAPDRAPIFLPVTPQAAAEISGEDLGTPLDAYIPPAHVVSGSRSRMPEHI